MRAAGSGATTEHLLLTGVSKVALKQASMPGAGNLGMNGPGHEGRLADLNGDGLISRDELKQGYVMLSRRCPISRLCAISRLDCMPMPMRDS